MALLAAVLIGSSLGCRQSSFYEASNLPAELVAAPIPDVHRLDLSFLTERSASSEAIQPGDLLTVMIATGAEEEQPVGYPLRVGERGMIEVPLIGDVLVAGLEPVGAETAIRQAGVERGIYRRPAVSVIMETRRSNQVTVLGAVEEPGTYSLPSAESNLLASLVAAGGLSKDADTIVEVRQEHLAGAHLPLASSGTSPASSGTNPASSGTSPASSGTSPSGSAMPVAFASAGGGTASTTTIDLVTAAANQADYRLGDGAVVTVLARQPRTVQVIGLVKQPDQFEIPPGQDVRLLDALALASGRTTQLADKVRVIRNLPGRPEPVIIEASVSKAKSNGGENILLAAGDVVSVEETPTTFTLDMLRSFMRFGFSATVAGM